MTYDGARAAEGATITFVLFLAGCAAVQRGAPPAAAEIFPSLEQIFLDGRMLGSEPVVVSLAPDGAHALVRWNALHLESTDMDRALCLVATRGGPADDPAPLAVRSPAPLAEILGIAAGAAAPSEFDWSPDGRSLACAAGGDVWILDPVSTLAGERPVRLPIAWSDPPPAAIEHLEFARSGTALWLTAGGELWEVGVDPLSEPRAHSQALATDAGQLSWSRDRGTAFDPEGGIVQVAEGAVGSEQDGAPPLHIARLDARGALLGALALEGFAVEPAWQRAELSGDGSYVAAWRESPGEDPGGDPSAEPSGEHGAAREEALIPDYLTERVTTTLGRSESSDDRPPRWTLGVWSTADGTRREVELPPCPSPGAPPGAADSDRWWLDEIGWSPPGAAPGAPARYAFHRTSADWRRRELWSFGPEGARRLCVEEDPHWVENPSEFARWSRDGAALLVASECFPAATTPGHSQLFAVDPLSGAVRQLSQVAGEVKAFREGPDGGIAFAGSGADPARSDIWWLPPDWRESSGLPRARRHPFAEGWNSLAALASGGAALASVARLGRAAELAFALPEGAAALVAAARAPPEGPATPVLPERVRVAAADGTLVFAHVFLPPGVSLDRPPPAALPTVVFVHGAGYLQNVTDSLGEYPVNFLFHGRLARLGLAVVDCDYRGSAGYGARFRGEVRGDLARLALSDIAAVLDDLAARGVVDRGRSALYGGSYGGFLTIMALALEPGRWRAGAALRSVTDWRSYHPSYTQPRLGRPSTEPETYARCSPIDHAAAIRDPLLVLHGMQDRNVFVQDSVRLIEALIDAGAPFEAMLYPSQGHGFEDGRAWLDEYRRIESFLLEHLGVWASPAPAP